MVEIKKTLKMNKKKTHRIYFRATEEDKIKLQNRAKYFGVSMSKFIMKICLEKDPILLSDEGRKEIRELRSETNQVIRTLNLYHEKKSENSEYLSRVRKLYKRAK
jgi:uncharacterized protein (DUF1778 family)